MAEKRVPLGKPLEMSDDDFDAAFGEFTPEAIEEARQALNRQSNDDGRRMGAATDDSPDA